MLNLEKYVDQIPKTDPRISLDEGGSLSINSYIRLTPGKCSGLTEILSELSAEGLESLKTERLKSVSAEKTIAAEIAESFSRWTHQAAASAILQSAVEIATAEMPSHSKNKWETKSALGGVVHSVSNQVYEMIIEVCVSEKYFRASCLKLPEWAVTYHFRINEVPSTDRAYNQSSIIDAQQKKFTGKERAEKYVENLKAQYARYFTEEAPPVPQKYAHFFSIMGVLLPGYRLEPAEAY
ncbi:MAG: hypothetical protein LBL15_02450 [Oscillospiraceae bacterium]|jgi:hypothetical protein|nr:hypothetical protein [Oscillospiraceae bacterium]